MHVRPTTSSMMMQVRDTAAPARASVVPLVSTLSRDGPTPAEQQLSESLKEFLALEQPLEKRDQEKNRQEVLGHLISLFQGWAEGQCVSKGIFPDTASARGHCGRVLISGSYRLGVAGPGSDIDCICVAPKHISRDDFFGSLVAVFEADKWVSRCHPLPHVGVPIIELDIRGLAIDLLFARVDAHSVTNDFNFLDDSVLRGCEESDLRSLNGPRTTELIISLVSDMEAYKVLLRFLRGWAKQRGIYSNKAGYLGGVNYAILAAFVCQLYPRAAPAVLLFHWFRIMATWPWPKPIMLCKPYEDPELGYAVWDPTVDQRAREEAMPVLTPAYPCNSSTYSVSWSSLAVMHREFVRGYELLRDIYAKHIAAPGSVAHDDWAEVCAPSEFFLEFDHYLAIDVWVDGVPEEAEGEGEGEEGGEDEGAGAGHAAAGEGEAEGDEGEQLSRDPEAIAGAFEAWRDLVDSQMRRLVLQMQRDRVPLSFAYNFPKCIETQQEVSVPGKEEPLTVPKATFFVALAEDYASMRRSHSVDLSRVVGNFKGYLLRRREYKVGMRVAERLVNWSSLPDEVWGDKGREWAHQQRERVALVRRHIGLPSWTANSLSTRSVQPGPGGRLQGFLGNGFGMQAAKEWQKEGQFFRLPLGAAAAEEGDDADGAGAVKERAEEAAAAAAGRLPGLSTVDEASLAFKASTLKALPGAWLASNPKTGGVKRSRKVMAAPLFDNGDTLGGEASGLPRVDTVSGVAEPAKRARAPPPALAARLSRHIK